MPRVCAFGCRQSGVPMHCFPNHEKFPERFKTWVTLCGGKLEKLTDYKIYIKKKVCDKHFTDKDRNRYSRLNALAVPSLYLSDPSPCESSEYLNTTEMASTSQSSTTLLSAIDISATENLPNIIETDPCSSQTATFKLFTIENIVTEKDERTHILQEHNYSAASRNRQLSSTKSTTKTRGVYYSKIARMSTQIKQLRSEISRSKKNGKFGSRLRNAQKLSESLNFQRVVKQMPKPSQLFINMQLQTSKKPKGRRFAIEEKILSLSLYKKSPKCYALLQKYFTLPSIKAMKRLLSKIKLNPGINNIIFKKIKNTMAEKDTTERVCSLIFDEMSITACINYNNIKDTIEGFSSINTDQFADHALVFMVKGIKQNFKQPIAYYFTNCLKRIELKEILKTVIRHAQDSGLIIINTVCDQSAVNVSTINKLIAQQKASHLRHGLEWKYDHFSVNGRKIIPLYDTPHLIKGIRNNLLTKDLVYTTKNEEKIVKWEYFQKVYAADKALGEIKLLHKITEEHINPDKINKMRVKTATQIFSHSVAVVTDHLTKRGNLPEECNQLIDITLLLNNLFDSLNVSSFNVPDGKIYKGAIRKNSPHHQLWRDSKTILESVKFVKKKVTANKIRLVETSVPSVKHLIKTIKGMEAISEVLLKKYRFDALLTRNFNQDPVENFFGNIRSYGVRNIAPNTISFEGAFKALLLNNYSSPHSRRANCEEDGSECLQSLDFFLRENCNSSQLHNTPEVFQYNENLLTHVIRNEEDAGQRNYVCGWILTKCLKHICKSCQQCRQTLLNTAIQKDSYTFRKEYANKSWLCYPSKDVENCFQEIQNITELFLKDNVPKCNVKSSITMYCDLFIDFPFECLTHKEQLKKQFLNYAINVLLYSWCRSVNRILAGKISYVGDDITKNNAMLYYKKYKHYKNKK